MTTQHGIPPLLQCRNLTLGYGRGRDVLKNIDMEMRHGEIVALLGPNGAGKSTLIKGCCGSSKPLEGTITLQGDSVLSLPPRTIARRCAVVPQHIDPTFGLLVRTLVDMGRYARLPLFGGPGPEDRQAVNAALDVTGTAVYQNRPTNQLSGGELQRVLLARALAQQAPLLLLDEPFSAMDAAWRIRCFDLLQREAQTTAVLVALHDINLAALYCTRLIFLKNGGIAFDGPPETLFTETALSELYETEIKIGRHPVTGGPQAFPVPGALSLYSTGITRHNRNGNS